MSADADVSHAPEIRSRPATPTRNCVGSRAAKTRLKVSCGGMSFSTGIVQGRKMLGQRGYRRYFNRSPRFRGFPPSFSSPATPRI